MKLPSLLLAAALVATVSVVALAKAEPAVLTGQSNKEKLKAEVAAMDDAFCAMAKTHGLRAAFQFYAAPDVAFIDTDPRQWRGPAAVLQRIGPDKPGRSLTWSAYFTDVSDDGTLGYNYGRFEFRRTADDGKVSVSTGWFLTIWKRQPDGSWKYVMDNGAPDEPASKPAAEKKA